MVAGRDLSECILWVSTSSPQSTHVGFEKPSLAIKGKTLVHIKTKGYIYTFMTSLSLSSTWKIVKLVNE
jgi:hypothetical protein